MVKIKPENVVEAIPLADKLAGSVWLYSWNGNDYKFRFNEDGTIGILESWKNINWSVSGGTDVILEGKSSKMLLLFNSDKTTFHTRDWDGTKSDGRIVKSSAFR